MICVPFRAAWVSDSEPCFVQYLHRLHPKLQLGAPINPKRPDGSVVYWARVSKGRGCRRTTGADVSLKEHSLGGWVWKAAAAHVGEGCRFFAQPV